jgi:hypothetical protein
MGETDRKVLELQRELQDKEQQLQQERDLVARQQKTIKTQSETISSAGGRRSGHQHLSQPFSEPPLAHQRPSVMAQPPPPFKLPGNLSVPTPSRRQGNNAAMSTLPEFSNLSLSSPGPDVFQSSVRNQDQMSPTPSAPRLSRPSNIQPTQGYNTPGQAYSSHSMTPALPRPENMSTPSKSDHSAPRTPDPATMQNGAFAGMNSNNSVSHTPSGVVSHSMALVRMDEAAPDQGFTSKFEKLFHMAERYCYSHMNYPSSMKDSQLPTTIKERLMKASTRESAHQLGSTGGTRFFLMTKIILQWIIKHVFKQSLFTSFDIDADSRIAGFKDKIYQDTPSVVKFQLLVEISKEIRQIREHHNFPPFLDKLVQHQTNKLWAIVHPLMHQATGMDRADLRTLMDQAYSVAGDMAAAPFEWRFDFARIGSNYHTTMINRDPYIIGNEEDLAGRGLLVRLGFFPAVYLRDNSGGEVRTGQITRHHVLVKGQ